MCVQSELCSSSLSSSLRLGSPMNYLAWAHEFYLTTRIIRDDSLVHVFRLQTGRKTGHTVTSRIGSSPQSLKTKAFFRSFHVMLLPVPFHANLPCPLSQPFPTPSPKKITFAPGAFALFRPSAHPSHRSFRFDLRPGRPMEFTAGGFFFSQKRRTSDVGGWVEVIFGLVDHMLVSPTLACDGC